MRFSCALLTMFTIFQSAAASATAPGGYQVAQSVAVQGDCHCTVELLEDSRITDSIRDDIAKKGNILNDSTLYGVFDKVPMRNAAVQIVDRQGNVEDRRDFDMPLATLDGKPVQIGLPVPIAYELTVDRNRGDLLFSGPATYFFSVSKSKFVWIHFLDDTTHRRYELVATTNLRNEFSVVERADRRGKDILLLYCEFYPAGSDGEFRSSYMRVHFADGEWRAKRRVKVGDFCRGDQ